MATSAEVPAQQSHTKNVSSANMDVDQRRPSFHPIGSRQSSSPVLSPLPQVPAQVMVSPEGFRNAGQSRPGATDYPVIPTRPPLRPTISFGGVSQISYYSTTSTIDQKDFNLSIEECEPLRPSSRHDWRFYVCFACTCALSFICEVSTTALCTALPYVARDISLTAVQSFWIPGSFLMSAALTQPLFMRLSVALGCKSLLLLGLVLFTVGCTASALAKDSMSFLAGRSLEGIGVGAISILINLTLSQISHTESLEPKASKVYERLVSQASWLGFATGPIVGSALTQTIGWRDIFWLQIHFSIASLIILTFLLRMPYVEAGPVAERLRKVDYPGWLLLSCSIVSFAVSISWAGTTHPWDSWYVVVPLVVGFLGFAGWCVYNMYQLEPILPVSIFRNQSALVSCFGALAKGALLINIVFLMPIFFRISNITPVVSSVLLESWTFSILVAGALNGYVLAITGYRWPIWIGWVLTTIGIGLMTFFNSTIVASITVVIGLITGIAIGFLSPGLATAISSAASNDDETIHSTSLYIFFTTLGKGVGVLVAGTIFLNSLEHNLLRNPALSANASGYAERSISFANIIAAMGDSQEGLRSHLITGYTDSLRNVWIAGCALAGLMGFLSLWFTEDYRPDRRTTRGRTELE